MNNSINPVNQHSSLNHGAIAIEQSRAVTEAQGKLLLAKQFPRDENESYRKLMDSCKRPSLAGVACYSFPRGGQVVSGPSIRLAEEIARVYGNIEYGIRELSNDNGESEMEAYAWDLQTNTVSTQKFKVKHMRDKRGGGQKLTDQRDIYEITANMGARRLRSRLLAVLPPDLVESAIEECRKTLSGSNDIPIADRCRKMVAEFAKQGVTKDMIVKYLKHDLDAITNDEIADMLGIFNSIKNGQCKREEFFIIEQEIPQLKPSTEPFTPAAKPQAEAAQKGKEPVKEDDEPAV